MTNGIWLPEDLLTGIAKYSNEFSGGNAPGLWGTELGSQLRQWYAEHQRPLLWADRQDGPMLLDPLVASKLSGFSHKVKAKDIAMFALAWDAPSWQPSSFDGLAALTPPYLHFSWPSWKRKTACEAQERDASMHVMGTDGNGACVYWTAQTGAANTTPQRWECLNDGACVQSSSSRAVFESELQCKRECGQSWQCIKPTVNVSHNVAFCLPVVAGQPAAALNQGAPPMAGARFPSADACEAQCDSDSVDSDRALVCHDWEAIIVSTLWTLLITQVGGFCIVRKWVVPRQEFKTGMYQCCSKKQQDQGRPWCGCLFTTFCPCFQWLRVIAFLCECPRTACGRCCSGLGCLLFTGCCVANPFGFGAYIVSSFLFGACKSGCTRYKLRQRLKIEGALWEDVLIHCFVGSCAWCQEAVEISTAGYSGIAYQKYDEPIMPLDPAAPAPTPVGVATSEQLLSVGYQPEFFQQEAVNPAMHSNRRLPTTRPLLQQPEPEPELEHESTRLHPAPQPEPQPQPEPEPEPEPEPDAIIPWGPDHPDW